MPYVIVRRSDRNGVKYRQALDTIYVPPGTDVGAVPSVVDIGAGVLELAYGFPGGVFSMGFPFFTQGDVLVVPLGQFDTRVDGWAIRTFPDPGTAAFSVHVAPSVTGAFTDMIGGGTAPSVTGALGAQSLSVTSWATTAIGTGSVLRVGCSVLTVPHATLTLHFTRVA